MNWPWKRVTGGLVVIVLAALYFSGSLDDELYKVGLNFHKCGENGFGAVFCGSALTQYENRIKCSREGRAAGRARTHDDYGDLNGRHVYGGGCPSERGWQRDFKVPPGQHGG